jgi:broad specificity phosphatase PhoE
MLPRIYLIRHGETEWSHARRAYELYAQRGRRDGRAGQDWLEAGREIRKDEAHK